MNQLLKFWQTEQKQPNTEILKVDYDILNKNNLLISADEWEKACVRYEQEYAKYKQEKEKYEQDEQNVNKIKEPKKPDFPESFLLHTNLIPEPFDGDIENAKIYIVSLNPHAGDYTDEYTNNFYHPVLGNTLRNKITKNIYQQNTDYPFYYLHPDLKETGGYKWWKNQRLKYLIQILKNDLYITEEEAIKFVAKNVFDLELCPYHSASWKNKKIIPSLPSVQKALDFFKHTIIPEIIKGNKKLIMLNGTPTLNEWLKGTTFSYNNKELTFEELYNKLHDTGIICYWKEYGKYAQRTLVMNYDKKTKEIKKYPAGKFLLEHLEEMWRKEHKSKI